MRPRDLPRELERDYPLARLTTIRTGGRAEWFARPQSIAALERLLHWAHGAGVDVGVVGSGSNLLIADAGFAGLVLKLDGALARIDDDGDRLVCGSRARRLSGSPASSSGSASRGRSVARSA